MTARRAAGAGTASADSGSESLAGLGPVRASDNVWVTVATWNLGSPRFLWPGPRGPPAYHDPQSSSLLSLISKFNLKFISSFWLGPRFENENERNLGFDAQIMQEQRDDCQRRSRHSQASTRTKSFRHAIESGLQVAVAAARAEI